MRTILWPFMSDAGRATWIALQNHTEWEVREHVVRHTQTSIELWTANTFFHFGVYHGCAAYNLFDKWACHTQAHKLANKQLAGNLLAARLEK